MTDLQGKFTFQMLHVFIAIEVFKVLHLFPVLTSVSTLIDFHRNNCELLAGKEKKSEITIEGYLEEVRPTLTITIESEIKIEHRESISLPFGFHASESIFIYTFKSAQNKPKHPSDDERKGGHNFYPSFLILRRSGTTEVSLTPFPRKILCSYLILIMEKV